MLSTVKLSDSYKSIANCIGEVMRKNRGELSKILTMVGKRYAKLLHNSSVLWLTIEKEKWNSITCIEGFLNNFME